MRIEMAQYILPFLVAVIGILVLVIHASQHWRQIKKGNPGPPLLILVSLLCTAYGVERLTYSEQFAARLDRIDQELGRNVSAIFTDDRHEIWRGIDEMMTSMEHDIRTVQSGDRRNKIPDEFRGLPARLADRLAEMKQEHFDVKYRIVLVFDGKKSSKELAEIEQDNCDGLKFWRDKGLGDNVELSVYDHDTLTKFDVLIIDEKYVNEGFDTSEGAHNVEIQNAMQWRNQKELAHKFARWFDETIWKHTVPFEVWLKEQKVQAGSPAPVVGCSNL